MLYLAVERVYLILTILYVKNYYYFGCEAGFLCKIQTNFTGATSGAGNVYTCGAPEFTPVYFL
jgi:hypothetical protein